jgi:hypothetical protein
MESEHARHRSFIGILIMILHRRILAVFIASVLLAEAGAAWSDAGIVQCVDAAGSIMFTDAACNTAADAARASSVPQTVSDNIKISPASVNPRTTKKAPAAKREGESMQNRRSALDASTVRAAKVSLLAMDAASALIRQQVLARRSARAENGWALW